MQFVITPVFRLRHTAAEQCQKGRQKSVPYPARTFCEESCAKTCENPNVKTSWMDAATAAAVDKDSTTTRPQRRICKSAKPWGTHSHESHGHKPRGKQDERQADRLLGCVSHTDYTTFYCCTISKQQRLLPSCACIIRLYLSVSNNNASSENTTIMKRGCI